MRRLRPARRVLRAAPASAWRALRSRRALTPDGRRARAVLAGAVVFAAVVLLTSFPLTEVLSQRSALSDAARKLASFDAANRALSGQVAALGQPGSAAALARHDYGFVAKGQRAYDILPPSGGVAPTSTRSGYVPLDAPPVDPGSASSQALIGVAALAPSTGPTHRAASTTGARHRSGPPPGYWGRVVHSLEFWN